jgi:hypothetical protein
MIVTDMASEEIWPSSAPIGRTRRTGRLFAR